MVPAPRMSQHRLDFARRGVARRCGALCTEAVGEERSLCTGTSPGREGCAAQGAWHVDAWLWACRQIQRDFKAGNEEHSQAETCQAGCRVPRSSPHHCTGC